MHLLVGSSSHRVWVILNIVRCYSSVLYYHVTLHLAALWLQVWGGEWSSVGRFTGLSGQPFLCLAVLLIKHLYFLSGGMRLNRCCPRWDKRAAVFLALLRHCLLAKSFRDGKGQPMICSTFLSATKPWCSRWGHPRWCCGKKPPTVSPPGGSSSAS